MSLSPFRELFCSALSYCHSCIAIRRCFQRGFIELLVFVDRTIDSTLRRSGPLYVAVCVGLTLSVTLGYILVLLPLMTKSFSTLAVCVHFSFAIFFNNCSKVDCLYFDTEFIRSWHFYLICTGQTTIEFYENRERKKACRALGRSFVHEYDLGLRENLKIIFGSHTSLWKLLMPSFRPLDGDGYLWDLVNDRACSSMA
eukprot:jgi/Galph1/1070/GphlegSOOS_G5900.1